jgi:ADP-ribosylglycohydrolase
MVKISNQQGLLVGFTIGNSIGNGYIKNKRKNMLKLKKLAMKENITYNLLKGEVTDDIKLCFKIIRMLVKTKIIYNDENFINIYLNWSKKCNKCYYNNNL